MYGIYTKEVADAIYQFYANQSKVGGVSKKPDSAWQPLWYYVKLTEDLDAASDPETGYTQATANVVKYSNTADDLDMEEVTDTDLEITVTNRSTGFSGSVGDYLWVVQPYGIAEFIPLVTNSSSGGGLTIRFRITASYNCGECYVSARVISVPYGVSVWNLPGVDVYDNYAVDVYDRSGCWFNEPPEDLSNRIGHAVYMTPLEDGPCPDTIFNAWEVISLCDGEATCGT